MPRTPLLPRILCGSSFRVTYKRTLFSQNFLKNLYCLNTCLNCILRLTGVILDRDTLVYPVTLFNPALTDPFPMSNILVFPSMGLTFIRSRYKIVLIPGETVIPGEGKKFFGSGIGFVSYLRSGRSKCYYFTSPYSPWVLSLWVA